MTNHLLRPASLDDAERLTKIAFESKAYWGYSAEFMEACRAELRVSAETLNANPYTVFEVDGKIVGFHVLAPLSETEIELDALFLDPAHIGKGTGRLLMEDAIKKARTTGASKMIIQSDPNAEPFYTAFGATLISQTESGSIPGRFLPTLAIQL